jgi:orotidine-5'-phosphate decarboxylase
LEFNIGLIDALYDIVPAVKPQSAFYEALGPTGVGTLKLTMDYAKEKGMYVILDAKRNDIGSTASSYSDAYLGAVKIGKTKIHPFNADALTINAYIGSDGIKPFLKTAKKYDKAMFALVKTSNPSAGEFQDKYFMIDDRRLNTQDRRNKNADVESGEGNRRKTVTDRRKNPYGDSNKTIVTKRLYTMVGELMEEISYDTIGRYGFTRIGAVVGATYPDEIEFLRRHLKNTFFLVPGYGAQGGSAEMVRTAFDKNGRGAIINSSRAIIAAWKQSGNEYRDAARAEALKMRKELREVLGIS